MFNIPITMYLLPFYIKRYKTKITADCFINSIRSNTLYIYDKDGYIRQSNPRGMICRNEKDRTLFLKDRPYYSKASGGVTALMISEDPKEGHTVITSIAYHDWVGTIWSVLGIIVGIFGLVLGSNPLLSLFIFAIVFFMNSLDKNELKRQQEFIEQTIKNCELKQG